MRELYQITWTNSLKFYRQQQQSPPQRLDSLHNSFIFDQTFHQLSFPKTKNFKDHRNCSFILINLFLILHYLRRHLPITSPPLFHFSNVSFWHFFNMSLGNNKTTFERNWKKKFIKYTKLEMKTKSFIRYCFPMFFLFIFLHTSFTIFEVNRAESASLWLSEL